MLKCPVAIATENPRVLYLIIELLKELGLEFVVCTTDDTRCGQAKVVITTLEDSLSRNYDSMIVVDEKLDPDLTSVEILAKLNDVHEPTLAVVGVDPGMRFGVALLMDGVVTYKNFQTSPGAAVRLTLRLKSYVKHLFPSCHVIARVGTGSKLYSTLYLRDALGQYPDLGVELVNEHHTTLSGGFTSDQTSAILIAGRVGRQLTDTDMILEPKEGYVRSLQQFIRRFTRSKKDISKEEARSILLDKTSLDSILEDFS
ncbi:MAG: hypothetical protein ACW96M_06455 [Candidatus Thorarchaeota archaeon]|jgi:hypothetical protein